MEFSSGEDANFNKIGTYQQPGSGSGSSSEVQ